RVMKQCKKMPCWKTPGPDGVQGFWIKKVTALHKSIASQFDKCAKTNPIYALLILNMASCLQRYTKCVITFVTRSEFSINKIKKLILYLCYSLGQKSLAKLKN
uniref:Reverse transcriptase domain-containing protein n=1 Tax=Amphimedon queenslandica TaxID=400682 RepID=A0A1X7T1N7_AMPQE